jgi:hypothetical protein
MVSLTLIKQAARCSVRLAVGEFDLLDRNTAELRGWSHEIVTSGRTHRELGPKDQSALELRVLSLF